MITWQKEIKQSIKSNKKLNEFFDFQFPKTDFAPIIPQAIIEKIKKQGLNTPLGNQFLPRSEENLQWGEFDPIGDHKKKITELLIHRYKNRVLFLPTNICPVHCRYCFRRNLLDTQIKNFNKEWENSLKYISNNSSINEVIFSGGDPFSLSNKKLDYYLFKFSQIEHIKYIRFHTRYPVITPSRFDEDLFDILHSYHKQKKIIINIHTNHLDEWDQDSISLIGKLNEMRLKLISQSVLLKGVNDNEKELSKLFQFLVSLNIRPLYLHHPDQVKGGMHFYLSIEKGKKIYQNLRDLCSGWMLPQYIIDSPNASGKKQL